eukprot:162369-Pelagomonas_calceolata.AAC.2
MSDTGQLKQASLRLCSCRGDTMTVANESQGNTALAHVILSESDLLFGGCVVHAIDAVSDQHGPGFCPGSICSFLDAMLVVQQCLQATASSHMSSLHNQVLAPVASSPKAMARSAPSVDAAVAADLSWAAEFSVGSDQQLFTKTFLIAKVLPLPFPLLFYFQSLARMGLDPGQSKCTIFCPSNDVSWDEAIAFHLLAIAKYAAQQPRAVLSLATESGARSLDAHILPNVQMQLNDFPSGTSTFTTKAGTSMTVIRMRSNAEMCHERKGSL